MKIDKQTNLIRILNYIFTMFFCLKIINTCLSLEDLPVRYLRKNHDGFFRKYIFETILGSGTYGTVFLAYTDTINSKKVAIKVQRINDFNILRYSSDIRFPSILRHENIVEILEFKIIENLEYSIYEYLPFTFSEFFDNNIVGFKTFIYLIKQILDALNYLRIKKIVYLDLKANNIMITEDLSLKLIDFGISTFEESQNNIFEYSESLDDVLNDSAYYFYAPEVKACQTFDHRADIWSLGHIFKDYFEKYEKKIKNKEYLLFVADFISKTLDPSPEKRISADKALLHPIFDFLYDFVFCFARLDDFFYSENHISLVKNGKKIFFKQKKHCFEIHCCCISDINNFKSVSNITHKFKLSSCFFRVFSNKIEKNTDLLKFTVIINQEVLPLQHLTNSQYKRLKIIFKILKTKLQN